MENKKITTLLNNDDGKLYDFPQESVKEVMDSGFFSSISDEDVIKHQFREEERDSTGVAAGLRSAADAITFGATRLAEDKLARKYGIGLTGEEQKIQEEESSTASTIGTVAGFVAPALLSGGTSIALSGPELLMQGGRAAAKFTEKELVNLAGKGGSAVAKRIVENKIAKGALTGAVDGVIQGAGQGLNKAIDDSVFDNKPLVGEKILAEVGVGALIGGIATPILNGAGAIISKTASRASDMVGDFLPSAKDVATGAYANTIGVSKAQAAKMGKQQLDELAEKGLQVLKAEVDDAGNIIGQKSGIAQVGELKNLEGSYSPKLKAVTKAEGASLANKYDELDKLSPSLRGDTIKSDLIKQIEATSHAGLSDSEIILNKFGKQGLFKDGVALTTQEVKELAAPMRLAKFDKYDGKTSSELKNILSQIQESSSQDFSTFKGLWEEIKTIGKKIDWDSSSNEYKTPTQQALRDSYSFLKNVVDSEAKRLDEPFFNSFAKNRKDYSLLVKLNSFADKKIAKETLTPLLSGVDNIILATSVLHPWNLAVLGMKKLYNTYSKEATAVFAQDIGNIAKTMNFENKVTKGLNNVRKAFFEKNDGEKIKPLILKSIINLDGKKEDEDRQAMFRRNVAVIKEMGSNLDKSLTTMTDRTRGIAQVDEDVTGSMIGTATNAVQFLNSKVPKNPFEGKLIAKDYKYPETEISKFNRYMHGVNDPVSVLDDLAKGYNSPEGLEAIKTIYPNIYQELTKSFIEEVAKPEVQSSLTYDKRLTLSNILGIPVDGMTDSSFLLAMQSNYDPSKTSQEDGSKGNIVPKPKNINLKTEIASALTPTQRVTYKG